jgi:hypothetical protein
MRNFGSLVVWTCAWAAAWEGIPCAPVAAEEVTVQVPGADRVKIVVPAGWKHSIVQTLPALPPTLDMQEPTAPLGLKITFLPDPNGKLANEEEIKKLMTASTGLYVESSLEKKLEIRPMSTKNGKGFYATFTDASLVDKKEVPPGQFRIVTSGILVVGKQAAAFTLLTNRLDGKEYVAAMQLLSEGIIAP